jgi:Na+/proline symporter
MLRAVLGTVVGYIAMFVVLTAILFGVYFALGMERSFKPASYEPTTLWIALMFAVGLVAALIGGFVGKKIGGAGAIQGMVALIIVLTGIELWFQTSKDEAPKVRGPEVTALEAAMNARSPLWVTLVNPVIGIAGVLIGGKKAGGRAR